MLGQLAVNSSMAGARMGIALQAIQAGYAAWSVGLLLALFTVLPVLTAMPTGRLTDRRGYHQPAQAGRDHHRSGFIAGPGGRVFARCGAVRRALPGRRLVGRWRQHLWNRTQRTGGKLAKGASDRLRIFSWLGMAPALAAAVGPVLIGVTIDGAGFGWAYGLMSALPLLALVCARSLPRQEPTRVAVSPSTMGGFA